MSQQKVDPLTVGLSEAEKDDLEKMIGGFRRHRLKNARGEASQPLQAQIDSLTRRLADLSQMVLTILPGRLLPNSAGYLFLSTKNLADLAAAMKRTSNLPIKRCENSLCGTSSRLSFPNRTAPGLLY